MRGEEDAGRSFPLSAVGWLSASLYGSRCCRTSGCRLDCKEAGHFVCE